MSALYCDVRKGCSSSFVSRLSRYCMGVAVCLLVGCAMAPDGAPPDISQPAQYGVQDPVSSTAIAGEQTQEFIQSYDLSPQWWSAFGSDTLNALVYEGLGRNLELDAADKRLLSAHEQLAAQIGASRLPSVDIGAQASRQRDLSLPLPGMPPTHLYNTFAGQVQASYTFDLFGAIRYQNRALAKRISEQAFELDAARNAVAANIVRAAIQLSALEAQRHTVQGLIELLQADLAEAQSRYEMGAIPRSSVLESHSHLSTISSQLPALRTRITTTRHALAILLGRRPDQAPEPLDFASVSLPAKIPVVLPSVLLQSRPDIQAASAALQAAAADVGVATANMFPQLSLSASMGQAGYDWATAVSGAGAIWGVAASLAQPLFRGGALRAKKRAAQQDYLAAVSLYKKTVVAAFAEVADALAELENDAIALAQSKTVMADTKSLYEETLERVRLGALPPAAGRARAQQLAQAELDVLGGQANRLLDTVQLFHAMAPAESGVSSSRLAD